MLHSVGSVRGRRRYARLRRTGGRWRVARSLRGRWLRLLDSGATGSAAVCAVVMQAA